MGVRRRGSWRSAVRGAAAVRLAQTSRLRRPTFGFDVLACPRCEGRMRLLAMVTEPKSVARYLRSLGEPTEAPARAPARGPPFWKSPVLRRAATTPPSNALPRRSVSAAVRPRAGRTPTAASVPPWPRPTPQPHRVRESSSEAPGFARHLPQSRFFFLRVAEAHPRVTRSRRSTHSKRHARPFF